MTSVDRPSAYLPGDRRRALATGTTLPSRVRGAALFADISGFTPLTEALAQELGSHRASEVLTGHLNRVFHAVIGELNRFGGVVIYFSGDAITCWLDGDDGARASAAGIAMLGAIDREGEIRTPGGLSFRLGLKVAVAAGAARRFVVGDPEIQLIDVLAGGLVDRLAEAEHLAEAGEVVVHESALAGLHGRAELGESRRSAGGGSVTVVERLLDDPRQADGPEGKEEWVELPDELARPWLLPPVYERLASARGELLAELRPAYPMFVSFGGIDYDADDAAAEKLDEFVRACQRVLSGYGGNVLQLTLGDKGAYLYGVFGTPLAHEDDADRACAAALEVVALEHSTAAREIRLGVGYGRLRSGTYGHERRRTFVCLGDAVNLAARLMSMAPPASIYASEEIRRRAGARFVWQRLQPLQVKGKSAPVAAYRLTGSSGQHARRSSAHDMPLVGRIGELAMLEETLDEAIGGRGRIVGVCAEAGMGKSRLAEEFCRGARRRGILTATGACQSYGTSTGYFVWRDVWRTLFALDDHAPASAQVAALEQALGEIDPALVARAPLLDALLGLSIPDTELTSAFDPKLRKTSLENLLADCLRARARRAPLLLVLEDCHWLDPLSRDLLDVIAPALRSEQVMLLLVYRPDAALSHGLALGRLPDIVQLELAALEDREMSMLVRSILARSLAVGAAEPVALRDLVVARAQGIPFYAEELLNYVHDQGIDPFDERALQSLQLPDSLHSLILSRIDALSESPRSKLKVASVVGRVFRAPMLPGVYPQLGDVEAVRADLGTLRMFDLVRVEREEDESYLFKHAVTQEVAYESLPYGLRATLHRHVGRYLEGEPDAAERQIDLLAHHYWHSDDEPKKRLYLGLAARAAQASYANAAAIEYFERLAPLVPDAERIDALLELGKVLELVGEWDRARSKESAALELAVAGGDERAAALCEAALAEVARKQNQFDESRERLGRAGSAFEALGDDAGLGRVLHLRGTLAAQQGSYAEARARYEESLVIRRRLGDLKMMASLLTNLGIVAEYEGDYPLARSLHEQALELVTTLGDRWVVAVSMNNLGMIATHEGRHDEARERFEESIRLQREVGDSWAVAIMQINLGNANRDLGDFAVAREQYAGSLGALREHDDGWNLAFLLEDVGRLAAMTGEPQRALELLGAADALRERINAPRDPTLEREIGDAIEPAAATLPGAEREAARAAGRGLDQAHAIELALSIG